MTEDADQPLTTWLPMVLDDNVFATIIGRRSSGKSALVARHPWLPEALRRALTEGDADDAPLSVLLLDLGASDQATRAMLAAIGVTDAAASADSSSAEQQQPSWVMRNKLLAAVILIVMVVLSTPAYARLLPPEVHEFLHEDEGPAAFCLAFASTVFAGMAVYNSKKKD